MADGGKTRPMWAKVGFGLALFIFIGTAGMTEKTSVSNALWALSAIAAVVLGGILAVGLEPR